MKALVKKEAAPGLWMEDVDMPQVGDNEVLIKVRKAGICGSDIHIYTWNDWASANVPIPLVTGHEFVGEIVEIGKLVTDFAPGDRVSGEGHITCGFCRNCRTGKKHLCGNTIGLGCQRHGCFAEYVTLPHDNVFTLPDNISDDIAAIMDPLGNAVHTACSFDLVGEDVLITGAGPIGLMASKVAYQSGARHVVITDINEYRLELARKMNCCCVVNISKVSITDVMKTLKISEGFDVGLEMSGNPEALQTIIDHCVCGAHIALLGLLPKATISDWEKIIFKGLFLKGIYGREIFNTWYKVMHLLDAGMDVSPVITHRYAMEDFTKAFNVMMSGQCGKVLLEWES